MNEPIPKIQIPIGEAESFKSARNDLLDAFFELEFQVARWLKLLGYDDIKSPFGNRLQSLIDHEKLNEKASKKQSVYIRNLAQECAEPLRIRNALVHSRASYGYIGGEPKIFLQTLSLAIAEEGALLPISYADIKMAEENARKIAGRLSLWYSQRAR